jgi:membrane peptidoglycan carboxypeptidase
LIGVCLAAGLLVAGVLFPFVGGLGLISNKASVAVSPISGQLTNVPPPEVTTVADRTGRRIATLYEQYRIPKSWSQISNVMKVAIVSVEDKRFYQHGPLDPKGIVRAAAHDVGGGSLQGASTLTQQYVKNYRINVIDRNNKAAQQRDRADTIGRKLRNAQIAEQIGAHESKKQILTGYLNVVSFAPRVFGVGAAARVFFHTTADKLTLVQSALLAAVVNNPNAYSPWQHPKAAQQRRNRVLSGMVKQGKISARRGAQAMAAPLGVVASLQLPSSNCIGAPDYAGFFCDYIKQYLERHGWTEQQIDTGGYTIKTSLDPRIAKAAKKAAMNRVSPTADGVAAAFSVIRPGTTSHPVLAMVSNRSLGTDSSKGETTINVVSGVTDDFGAGSTFKIFNAAAALEEGKVGLHSRLPNPHYQCFQTPKHNKYTSCYPVHNLGHYPNPISLQDALATSPNVAFVNLEKEVSVPRVLDMAYRLGMRRTLRHKVTVPGTHKPATEFQAYRHFLPFTLGFSALSPLEEANVAATIKSGGTWCPPNPILSITGPNGKKVPVPSQPCERAVSPGVARALMQGLSKDTVFGTSRVAAEKVGWHRPDIGKTGTTQNNESVAFVGGVSDYAVSALVFADGKKPAAICPGHPITHISDGCSGTFGGTVASPIYFHTLQKVLKGITTPPLPKPKPSYLEANPHGPIVPFVMMKPLDKAKKTLAKAGYTNIVVKHRGCSRPHRPVQNTVLGETPMGNAAKNTRVTLYVSHTSSHSVPRGRSGSAGAFWASCPTAVLRTQGKG